MITKHNISDVLHDLDPQDIEDAIESSKGDYIKVTVHIFNVGWTAEIECVEFNPKDYEQTRDNGNLYEDKDDFLMRLEQHNALPEDYQL